MNRYIIDTNVLVVANGKYRQADDNDVIECQKFLINLRQKHLSVDSLGLIIKEYISHASISGQPGMGDAFVKWLFYNQWNTSICERVEITPDPTGEREFLEFPNDEELKNFDRSDRKFVAVALSSDFEAIVCNATDSDWWDYKEVFKRIGLKIKFLCPKLIKTRKIQ